jgi:hypothetical protein
MSVRPGNPWDMKGYQQRSGESLRDYIQCFSKNFHELPSVAIANVISVFWDSTTCRTFFHEFIRKQPKMAKELLDITTRHSSSKEAIGATFILGNAEMVTSGGRAIPTKATTKGARKSTKGGKKG